MFNVVLVSFALPIINAVAAYNVELFHKGTKSGDLQWNVDYETKTATFALNLSATFLTEHAFGFGISGDGSVYQADLLLVQQFGQRVVVRDCWSNDQASLSCIEQQDYELLDTSVSTNHIAVRFQRLFSTCDSHDYQLDNGTTNVLTIFGLPKDKEGTAEKITLENFEKDLYRVQILKTPFSYTKEKDSKWFEILTPNITIPKQGTTYWCSMHRLPDFDTRVHGIGYESFISAESKGIVHHIEVFGCDIQDGEIPYFSGTCEEGKLNPQIDRCSHVLAAWAFGMEAFFYPNEAGLTFYSASKSRYVRLEMHYNNQAHLEGVVDRSGIRFHYTTRLREHEVGVVENGLIYTPNMVIPPGQSTFAWSGYCPSKCTSLAFPKEGINIFGSVLHTHLAGRKARTYRIRENTVKEISRDDHYSTWFEDMRHVNPPIKVLPGDVLVTSCEFSTEKRTNVTFGGLGIREEMCITYLHYYPATKLEVCKSSASEISLMEFFFFLKSIKGTCMSCKHESIKKEYENVSWNHGSVALLKSLYGKSSIDVHCMKPNREQWPGKWRNVEQPVTPVEKIQPTNNCTH
ncbi:dopamine beta-hydroxylase-like [Clavelina lepadiformis]|uniref:dopamine beta-hydroxylase-like n=1 Tax=Clavelina lepadiformis TaxID=159417 RepID=UPI0040410797